MSVSEKICPFIYEQFGLGENTKFSGGGHHINCIEEKCMAWGYTYKDCKIPIMGCKLIEVHK